MRRRRLIMIVGGCLVASVLIFALWPRAREPEYGGKKLSEWLEQYRPHTESLFIQGEVERQEAALAVRHIGTNGLPFLLRWLRYCDGPNQIDRIAAIHRSLPLRLRSRLIDRYLVRHGGRAYASAGLNGLYILGQEARPALPELWRMAGDTNFPGRAVWASFVLRYDLSDVRSPGVGAQYDLKLALRADNTDETRTNPPVDAERKALLEGAKH